MNKLLKLMFLSLALMIGVTFNSCGNKDDEPTNDSLKLGVYATDPTPWFDGETRKVFKIIDQNTMECFHITYSWNINNAHPNTISLNGKKWYYNKSYYYTFLREGNKIIVPKWDGNIFTINSDGNLIMDGDNEVFRRN